MPKVASFVEKIKSYAGQAGFDLCGIVSAEDAGSPELDYFKQWISEGKAGDMAYLESRNHQGELKRAALRNAVPWVKSVVVCAMNYNAAQPYSTEVSDPTRGWISRYAWFQPSKAAVTSESTKATADYHDAVLHRLRKVEAEIQQTWKSAQRNQELQTRCYVDTGPIVERVYAKYAGIGWIGKNTCIINQQVGSWLFLGVILTSLDMKQLGNNALALVEDGGERFAPFDLPAADRCGSCTRCIEACPTGALVAPYKMDARKCIAYLTIEKKGEIPQEFRAKMGHHIFGCDICQDVCPWNAGYKHSAEPYVADSGARQSQPHRAPSTSAAEFQPRPELVHPPLRWIAGMTREQFNQVFRHSPIKRAKYEGIRRNVAIAMGNSGDADFIPDLEKLEQDGDANVAEHARWALERLASKPARADSSRVAGNQRLTAKIDSVTLR